MIRKCYRLVAPDGRILGSSGQRWCFESDIENGEYLDVDENDNLVMLPLPEGSRVVEVVERVCPHCRYRWEEENE